MAKKKSNRYKLEALDVSESLNQIHRDSVCTGTREIWLHSNYGGEEEPGVEYRMATTFIKNLNLLEKEGPEPLPVLIHMHCIGGEWNDGMAIYDAISLSPCKTMIIAYGQASSMSGIILQSANIRLMMPNCEFMAHTGTIDLNQETRTAHTMAERNMEAHKVMLGIFAKRCSVAPRHQGRSLDEIAGDIDKWIKDKGEINIIAEKAVEYGFADGLIGTPEWPTTYHAWAMHVMA